MKLQDYINSKTTGKKVPSDILSKWTARNGASYASQGAAGAQVYMQQYARTAGLPKVIALGRLALETGNIEFASEFFRYAAQLEGVTLEGGEVSDVGNLVDSVQSPADHPGFPSGLQPGKFAPMQPTDGKRDRAHYLAAPGYWGQAKRDGVKLIVFATPEQVFYQSRQMKLNGAPTAALEDELRRAASHFGSFVCEGELTYLSASGKEHRTASQAQTWNREKLNQPGALPVMKLYIFNCAWLEDAMLRTYGDMVATGHMIASYIRDVLSSEVVEPVYTARTTAEKAELVTVQKNEGREGEVWFSPLMPYRPGKHKDETYVRTKYGEEIVALFVSFQESTAPQYAFGSMQIESLDGRDLGSVGNGWSAPESWRLLRKFDECGPFPVQVYTRGYTEAGKCWEASYVGIAE